MRPNYYEILRVPSDADRATLRTAFREQARNRHPDHGGSHEQMLELIEAWEVLSDPVARREYDIGLKHPAEVNRGAADPTSAARARARTKAGEYPRTKSGFNDWLEAFDRELQIHDQPLYSLTPPGEAGRTSHRRIGAFVFVMGLILVLVSIFSIGEPSRRDSMPMEVKGFIGIVLGAIIFFFSTRKPADSRTESSQRGRGILLCIGSITVLAIYSFIVFLTTSEGSFHRSYLLLPWFITICMTVQIATRAWRGGPR